MPTTVKQFEKRIIWFSLLETGRVSEDSDLVDKARHELEQLGVKVSYREDENG